jgi:hypothetical protein
VAPPKIHANTSLRRKSDTYSSVRISREVGRVV